MICVSVGRGRHRMMIAEHKHLAEQGVQLVELRLDYIRRPVNLRRLLDERACPVITTCRRPEDGGKWMRSERDRQMLLRTAIADNGSSATTTLMRRRTISRKSTIRCANSIRILSKLPPWQIIRSTTSRHYGCVATRKFPQRLFAWAKWDCRPAYCVVVRVLP